MIRETMLIYLQSEEDREAIRRLGRLLYDFSLESDRAEDKARGHCVRDQMQAVAAEFRYLHGYLISVHRNSEETSLPPAEDRLARFAGRLAGRVALLIQILESRLPSPAAPPEADPTDPACAPPSPTIRAADADAGAGTVEG